MSENGCKVVGYCDIDEQSECQFYNYDKEGDVCNYHHFDSENNICNCGDAIMDSAEKLW